MLQVFAHEPLRRAGCYVSKELLTPQKRYIMLEGLKDKAAGLMNDAKVKEVVEKVQELAESEKGKEVIETVKEKVTDFIHKKK